MNKKYVKSDMDSGLGSDEDRRSRTKEQKQLHNQQLLSGCFIDAASLSDESEIVDQRRNDERRQGALLFQTSVPHFSMVQIPNDENFSFPSNNLNAPQFPETSTPYNSIVQLDSDEAARKSPLGFYVDLNDVNESPSSLPNPSVKKNIFSMVIDFEGPKKEKPVKLSSSLISFRKPKPTNKSNLLGKSSGSLSSSVSSINSNRDSNSVAGTSRQSEELEIRSNGKGVSIEVLSASLIKNLSVSSKSSSSSENAPEKISDDIDRDSAKESVDEEHLECDSIHENDKNRLDTQNEPDFDNEEGNRKPDSSKLVVKKTGITNGLQTCPQFVKLSDLECQKPKVDLNFTPRMSRSIPESSWVESPLLMSHSVGYRSAPHPLEPEHSDNNSDSENAKKKENSYSQPKKSVRKLGTDLLRMFLEEIGPDVVVEVDGHKLKAHKCILASRCQYFAALLSGNWLEKNGNVICLEGFSYESVYFALCHIYSGAAHVPDSISLVELASLADMLGLEGLKEVVEHALKQRHCHNFHKPCAGCCTGVLEVLPLSAAYGLDDLYRSCLQWITQHFVRVWPSRAFASLPRDVREKCYQQHVVHMNADKVLETISSCDKILATLPAMRWAEPVSQLILQLTDACHLYHRQHFSAVLGSQYVLGLDTGLGFGVCQIEDQMVSAARNLGVEQACRSYARCCKMLDQKWTRPFADMLNKVKLQLEQCLVSQADRLIRSNAWLRLDTALRTRIKELTPHLEPTSRLPRSTMFRNKKPNNLKPNVQNTALSSSDSSRNSSPGVNQQVRLNGTNGSSSLRRSLLLAAKAPQVPPSPSINRRSTLTQPTAASAAKSTKGSIKAVSKATIGRDRSVTIKPPIQVPPPKPSTSKRSSTTVSRNSSMGKKDVPTSLTTKRPDSRSSSPLKSDSRNSSPRKLDSRVTSPIKANVRSPSPLKDASNAPRRITKGTQAAKPVQAPTMQRSSTFLKEEPTVIGKVL
ncbi:uncharacterized protein LOC130440916 [Diorhabda sublineata]|uniref:uncharacterized protein LOC130440916 n=1 Tax=Diorhabda sublineata TaxID=1163346 RepID=UPI0024E102F3|nr:uncharacterized protein LOC130440916 [Diorhabda sublineata]